MLSFHTSILPLTTQACLGLPPPSSLALACSARVSCPFALAYSFHRKHTSSLPPKREIRST